MIHATERLVCHVRSAVASKGGIRSEFSQQSRDVCLAREFLLRGREFL
jgi:hypothetical protein